MITSLLLLSLALTPTPTIEPPTPTTQNSTDIQKIRDAVKEKVQEKLNQITQKTSNKKAIIGTITTISENEIVISYQNNPRTLSISDETVYIDAKRNKTTLDKIKVGQDILAMGYTNEQNILDAKRIVLIDIKLLENKNQTIIGKIVDTSRTSPIFILVPLNNKEIQYQIKTDTKTESLDQEFKKLDIKNLAAGQKVIVSFTPDPKISKTYYANQIVNFSYVPSPTPTKK